MEILYWSCTSHVTLANLSGPKLSYLLNERQNLRRFLMNLNEKMALAHWEARNKISLPFFKIKCESALHHGSFTV